MTTTLRTLLDRVEQGEGSDWIHHDGGACPVSPHQIVMVRLRDGWTDEDVGGSEADGWEWPWRQDEDDVIAYRIVEDES